MSLIAYDLTKIRSLGIPASSLEDWMAVVTAIDTVDAYWGMRRFIDTYGIEAFWAYKDQNMVARYGKKLTDAEKTIYIENMMRHESQFTE